MPDRPVIIFASDAPREDDPPEVQARKAWLAVEDWCDLLRARGEQVTLVPSPAAGKAGAA